MKRFIIDDFLSAKGAKRMGFRDERYIKRDVKDFFYLTLRPDYVSALPPAPRSHLRLSSGTASTQRQAR